MPNPPFPTHPEWTILRALQWASSYLKNRGIESPRSASEILLAHALGTDRLYLYTHHDQPLEQAELSLFRTFLQRRVQKEPVAYIVGHKGFWSIDLAVDPAVLVPRPETEHLVEAALAWLAGRCAGAVADVLDLGTGSGAIAVAMACEAGAHLFFASDISPEAVAIARQNALTAGVSAKVHFFVSDWLKAVNPAPIFDLIVSNPPYIAATEWGELQPEIVQHEPKLALDGGEDGLRCYREIVGTAHRHLKPGGTLMMEIGCCQREAVQQLVEQTGAYDAYECLKDYRGLDRVVAMQKKILRLSANTAN